MDEERTLYVNARVVTMNPSQPEAEVLLVEGDHIAAVGTLQDLRRAGVTEVDLNGATVIPGFNDCHCHILSFGLTLEQLDLGPERVRNIEEIKGLVAERAEQTAGNGWVLGRGYDQNRLEERRHPTRHDLDQVSGNHPVVLWHTSGHGLTANSRALQLAGINANTETPAGSDIVRDEHGEPTGVLFEDAAMGLLAEVMPAPTVAQGRDAILQAMQAMAAQGLTSATDAATGEGESIESALQMYRQAHEAGLAGRITLMPQIPYVAPPESDIVHAPAEFDTGPDQQWLRIGQTKIFSDGALTTRTAALFQPFTGTPDNRGILIWDPETLADMIDRAHSAGWQIATHAIGDRAIALVLDCYQRALQRTPRHDHRHRIEHCMMPSPEMAHQMAQMGVVGAIQPGFIQRLGDAYIMALGMERASQLNPMALFAETGVRTGFSSDRPVIPGAPLTGIISAAQRLTPDGVVLGAKHRISLLDAIRLYTAGAAYAARTDDRTGALRPGMLADFTALSHYPDGLDTEELAAMHVMLTVCGGRETYRA